MNKFLKKSCMQNLLPSFFEKTHPFSNIEKNKLDNLQHSESKNKIIKFC